MTTAKVISLSLGVILLALGAAAMTQKHLDGPDGVLSMVPALFLPLGRPFIAGSDLPPFLTDSGIVVVYLIPGAALVCVGWLAGRLGRRTET